MNGNIEAEGIETNRPTRTRGRINFETKKEQPVFDIIEGMETRIFVKAETETPAALKKYIKMDVLPKGLRIRAVLPLELIRELKSNSNMEVK